MLGDRIKSFLVNSFSRASAQPTAIQTAVPKAVQKAVQKAAQKVPVGASHEDLQAIAPPITQYLAEKVVQLPPPLPVQQALTTALTQEILKWQENPEIANNSLVVLGRPVEDVARILKTSLQTWPLTEPAQTANPTISKAASPMADPKTDATTAQLPAEVTVQFLLGGYQRPADPREIKQHIQRVVSKPSGADSEEGPLSIVVVPRLEQCFLRCINGWEGIEYLQNLTTRDPSRFWVFGCNHWAWAFLDRVCQVSAYLEQPLSLPELSGEELKAWLSPIAQEADVPDSHSRLQLEIDSDSYWNSLSNASGGTGSIAAALWLNSLRVKPDNPEDDSTNDLADKQTDQQASESVNEILPLVSVKPAVPSLMGLDVMDRYVLHTLLIHGEMTRSHLALSLGEAERKVRSRLQVLRREGLILQRGRRLSIHPAHYPKLFSELKNNNFLIGAR